MSAKKSIHTIKSLGIVKVSTKEGDEFNFSDSIMDFSPEEIHLLVNVLCCFANNAFQRRWELMQEYNRIPIKKKIK